MTKTLCALVLFLCCNCVLVVPLLAIMFERWSLLLLFLPCWAVAEVITRYGPDLSDCVDPGL
jgi:hypothetical protein